MWLWGGFLRVFADLDLELGFAGASGGFPHGLRPDVRVNRHPVSGDRELLCLCAFHHVCHPRDGESDGQALTGSL